MTNERKMRVDALITKLEGCKAECDELYNEEDGARFDLRGKRHHIAADACGLNMTRLATAEDDIKRAIEKLKEVQG